MSTNHYSYWKNCPNEKKDAPKDMLQQKYQIIKYENYIYKAMAGRYTLR